MKKIHFSEDTVDHATQSIDRLHFPESGSPHRSKHSRNDATYSSLSLSPSYRRSSTRRNTEPGNTKTFVPFEDDHPNLLSMQLSEPDFFNAKASFHRDFPEYAENASTLFENLRKNEFQNLDEQNQCYLDCTGAMLPPQSLIEQHLTQLKKYILGNPHSNNPTSSLSTKYDNEARSDVLRYCKADPDKYIVIWTHNASGALKLVGESYNFRKGGTYVYAPDAHNSLIGIASSAKKKGAKVRMFSFKKGTLEWDREDLYKLLAKRQARNGWIRTKLKKPRHRLLGITGQSNVTGFKHDLKPIIAEAHRFGWDVMLDAAALAPSMSLDLSQYHPEFVCLSFYKIFGYPTGIGALVARKDALYKLHRNAFYGGTVQFVYTDRKDIRAVMHNPVSAAKYEDGTINFQQTSAVSMGLKFMMNNIEPKNLKLHTNALIGWLRIRLEALYWSNGTPLVVLPSRPLQNVEMGSSIAFVMMTPQRKLIPCDLVEEFATESRISIRTGCFCNPGTGLTFFSEIFPLVKLSQMKNGLDTNTKETVARTQWMGLIRCSIGMTTDFKDCYRFVELLKEKFLQSQDPEEMIRMSLRKKGSK